MYYFSSNNNDLRGESAETRAAIRDEDGSGEQRRSALIIRDTSLWLHTLLVPGWIAKAVASEGSAG